MSYSRPPSFVLGFHGCERSLAEKIFSGDKDLQASQESYDWLGHGIYFWEDDPQRAQTWAEEKTSIKEAAVVGAVIDLGNCLSLMREEHLKLLKQSYEILKAIHRIEKKPLPKNTIGTDKLKRERDCAVINNLHTTVDEKFDSVRALFIEGKEAYPGAGFKTKTHVQVCVRTRESIKGYFRPMDF